MPKTEIETVITSSSGQVVSVIHDYRAMDEAAAVAAALEWENREEFYTRGKLKSVGSGVAGAVAGRTVPVLGKVFPGLRLFKTMNVIGKLEALRDAGLSAEAQADVEYILEKKESKATKAGLAMSDDPAVSASPTVYNIARSLLKANRGVDREKVATRIYDKLVEKNSDYLAIVEALFSNKSNPGLWISRLLAADDELAIIVIMGKIASR
jgi:hypothetical protein